MLSLRKPSVDRIQRFAQEQGRHELTYQAVGATATTPPVGYVVDRTRIRLGEGRAVFQAARSALENWQQFALGWVETWPPQAAIRVGEIVVVVARAVGLWWLNACRIVYVVDETGPMTRFGFAYGTLPSHAGSGEERFLIEWNHNDDSVWYDILAFSRPQYLLTRMGYPLVRMKQKRFGQESAAAMIRAVGVVGKPEPGRVER